MLKMLVRKLINKLILKEMTQYKLYLDDERVPQVPGPWVIVRSYDEFIKTILERGLPSEVSLDNDLGTAMEGYDCAKWMVNTMHFDTRGMIVNVHSANPKAPANIYSLINNWNKMVEKFGTNYKPDVEFEK